MKKITYLIIFSFFLFHCDTLKKLPPLNPEPVTGGEEKLGDAQFNYWRHSPLHPKNNKPIQFQVDVVDEEVIEKVELYLYEYELFYNEQGLPSKRRRNGGVWGMVNQWEIAANQKQLELKFDFQNGFPAATNIVYEFKVINNKKEVSTRMASFDAGNSPWPDDKILLYATDEDPMMNNTNICFLPDADYQQDLNKFLIDLEGIIYDGYHTNNMIAPHKDKWAFYYNRQEIDGVQLYQNYHQPDVLPAFLRDTIIQGIDAFGLIHQLDYSDGAYLSANISFLSNNLFTSESDHLGTVVHETAHAIFGLSDEYNGCGCFDGPYGNNMFGTLEACQEFNTSIGQPNTTCTQLENYLQESIWMAEHPARFATLEDCQSFNQSQGFPVDDCGLFLVGNEQWYRANSAICIMQDDGDDILYSFQKVCASIIDQYYQNMESEVLALNTKRAEIVSNHFGYEPVILMELDAIGEEMDLKVKKVNYGIPTKNWKQQQDLNIALKNKLGATQHQVNMSRPGRILIHSKNKKDVTDEIQSSRCLLNVPYSKNLAKATCNWKKIGVKRPQLENMKLDQVFDLEKVIKEKAMRFR